MKRRSPAEQAVRALVLEGLDNAAIHGWLSRDRLDVVDDVFLSEVRADTALPSPFLPFDVAHLPSQQVVRAQGVTSWFARDRDLQAAVRLLRAARAREVAEALMIGDAPVPWVIAEAKRFGITVSVRAIGLFRHFFFDTSVVDDGDLVAYLHERRDVPNEPVDEHDIRIVAARSRSSPTGLLMTRIRLGRVPTNLDLASVLKSTRTAAAVGALDATIRRRPRTAERLASVARSVSEILTAVGDPQTDMLDHLGRVALTSDETAVPMLDDLGGDHSTGFEQADIRNQDGDLQVSAGTDIRAYR
ncbi:MAG TPA: hypothetical protein VH062_00320 [Polyangiaceae bacterium]|jgi:hypothetical protein|nr:hypothetical protein [Polyangiaceae bacterium]